MSLIQVKKKKSKSKERKTYVYFEAEKGDLANIAKMLKKVRITKK